MITQATGMPASAAGRLAGEVVRTGRFALPDFGSFTVRETPKRTALNPRTGEKVEVKAGATVRFKARRKAKKA